MEQSAPEHDQGAGQRQVLNALRLQHLEEARTGMVADRLRAGGDPEAIAPQHQWSIGSIKHLFTESAALLVDEVFPQQPIRQWVLSFPYPLRFLFARRPERGVCRASGRLAALPLGDGAKHAELARLTQALALRIGRYLERQGLLERDAQNCYLAGDDLEAGPMAQLASARSAPAR